MSFRTNDVRALSTVQQVAGLVAVVFLLVGIAGFIPGLTTHYNAMEFAGHHSRAKLLGIFEVSVLHNLVHLAFGVIGLAMMRTRNNARSYLIAGGAVYLVLFVYGLVIDLRDNANFVPVNDADNWLHLALGAAMVVSGFVLGKRRKLGVF